MKPKYLSVALWLLLLGLTITLMLWPVSPSPLDPLPVQSIYAIQNLPWFIAVFSVWTVVLAALLFLVRGGVWERLALCLVFAMVFIQFWGAASPWAIRGDPHLKGIITFLQEAGRIPAEGLPSLPYFDFPGFSLQGLALSDITGTDIFMATRLFTRISGLVFILILYVAFLRLMRTPRRAALAVVLAVASSSVLAFVAIQFHPANTAVIYIALFVLLLTELGTKRSREWPLLALFMLLTMAATVGYILTPFFFSMVLLSGYVMQRMAKEPGYLTLSGAILPLILILAWQMYMTVTSFAYIEGNFLRSLRDFFTLGWLLPTVQFLAENLGPKYPWWANAARLFWWLSVFGFGTLLLLRRLPLFRKADSRHRLMLMIFAGCLATVAIGFVGTSGGVHGGLSKYLLVGPFVLAPVIVDILSRPRARAFAVAFSLAGILLLPPTLLINGDRVSSDHTFRYEVVSSEFLALTFGNDEGLTLYGFPYVPVATLIYTPKADFRNGPYIYGIDEEKSWGVVQNNVRNFRTSSPEGNVLTASPKGRLEFTQRFDIPTDHPTWSALEGELAETNRIYDVGHLQLYTP